MSGRLGIDVGGTFTDVVYMHEDGRIAVEKVPSTPHAPAEGIFNGIRTVERTRDVVLAEVDIFAQGSTVATNALLELKLPRTAVIVTRGFGDVLDIGTQLRPDVYSLRTRKAESYVPRGLVFEVDERVDRLGNVLTELTDEAIDAVIDEVEAANVAACAVSFLFSFRNPDHERRVAERLKERIPGIAVAISSDIAPEIGEYARTNTVAVSAALQPLIADYMSSITAGLGATGLDCPMYVMQSNGGVMTAEEAGANAHRMVLSGPAGGVLAAARIAERTGYLNQITFDMGGTSTDIALIHGGRPQLVRETEFDGKPLLVPQFDIHTIGSGGGSLARVDDSGLLRVGPESAGAMPGPACYGRGGTRPTTTDAHVVLGRIDPGRFLGGEMHLDAEAARRAVEEHVSIPLGITVEEAALGILKVADTIMSKGVRVVSVNRGFDPRDFVLLPFGGAGPMHAASVASIVGVGGVVIPNHPGTLSALGMAQADLKYDFTRVVDQDMEFVVPREIDEHFDLLIADAEERLAPSGATRLSHARFARFRYAWQDTDVEILLGTESITEETLSAAVQRFHEQHLFEFGHSDPEGRVELAGISIESIGGLAEAVASEPDAPAPHEAVASDSRPVYFEETGWSDVPVYERALLSVNAHLSGPAIIEEREATTVVPPRTRATIDTHHNIVLTFETEN